MTALPWELNRQQHMLELCHCLQLMLNRVIIGESVDVQLNFVRSNGYGCRLITHEFEYRREEQRDSFLCLLAATGFVRAWP